jgi:hypothetical protein
MHVDWKWMGVHVALLAVLGAMLRFVPQVPAAALVAAVLAVLGMMAPSMVFRRGRRYADHDPRSAEAKDPQKEIRR